MKITDREKRQTDLLWKDGRKTEWTKEKYERFEKFILGDDMDFYEEYTIHLTDKEQEKFFAENPEFMPEYPVSRDMIYMLRDSIYRGFMRKIKKYETGVE